MVRFIRVGTGEYAENGPPKGSPPRLSEEELGRLRDKTVTVCSDVVLINEHGQILLAVRGIDPLKGMYWLIGGGRNPGETRVGCAKRHLCADTGLDLPEHRFAYIGVYSTEFARRNEPPFENGSHGENFTFMVKITLEEFEALSLRETEYQSKTATRWFEPDEIIEWVAREDLHPELKDLVEELVKRSLL